MKVSELADHLAVDIVCPRQSYDRWRNDGHANPKGNKKMAEDIVSYLVENKIVKP